jgi:O-acetyl-ADP-ribose deacetylase
LNNIRIIKDSIIKANVDVIVNAANTRLKRGGGVDGAIHHAEGPELQTFLNQFTPISAGEVVITPAFNLKAKQIYHAVGPIWLKDRLEIQYVEILKKTYMTIFNLAKEHNINSIAIPNIFTGVYGFPKELAASTVYELVQTMKDIKPLPFDIHFYCFDEENYLLYKEHFKDEIF